MSSDLVRQDLANLPPDLGHAERRVWIKRWRSGGVPIDEIAAALGVGRDTVVRDWRAILAEISAETRDDLIAGQRALMDELRAVNYQFAMVGSVDHQKLLFKGMQHEAQLLGLYAPTKQVTEVGDNSAWAAEMVRLMAQLKGASLVELQRLAGVEVIDAEVVEPAEYNPFAGTATQPEAGDAGETQPAAQAGDAWSNL